ncbi:DUF485 domain-containing protein [Chloroflexota bacterium]
MMEHGPEMEWPTEKSQGFKTKLGLIMFAIYTPIYFSFILIAVVNPKIMAKDIGSLNVAIVYGFGIIILAIVQALVYNYICQKRETMEDPDKGRRDID